MTTPQSPEQDPTQKPVVQDDPKMPKNPNRPDDLNDQRNPKSPHPNEPTEQQNPIIKQPR
ncbi:hypothetical protein [Diaphorobacter aerolatus]|uniref:Uncharacterized protein n=1 Tax=Diaphorobacter aerolatus TaxID=1288495 RepID=A0A7H0GHP1_9BURK|nr:hypothetical protein [Diaphorobacter aerolatus]QNP47807.1 hypothetical protein H9K75_16815 [Diaphorobacter aerolatus]